MSAAALVAALGRRRLCVYSRFSRFSSSYLFLLPFEMIQAGGEFRPA